MAKGTWRCAYGAALIGVCLSGCLSERAELGTQAPQRSERVRYALEAEAADGGPSDPGSPPSLCVNELAELTPVDCAACAQDHCATQAASCGESCGALITCAAGNCAPQNISCITTNCFDCVGAAPPANNYASCLSEHCESACPVIASLAIEQQPPPPPPPPGECVNDLPSVLGSECTTCIDRECTSEMQICDAQCRSLITCVVNACGTGDNLPCVTGSCGACIGGANGAQSLASCMANQCTTQCRPLIGSSEEPDAGSAEEPEDDDDDDARDERPRKHRRPHHHGRGNRPGKH